ncbi:MAG: amidohydrolase [Calditrichaeota bacterium]|nr:amidohydrolase [Calditrichota bacterium]
MNKKSATDILQTINDIFPELILLRRSLHQAPEVGWKEIQTTARIIRFLENKATFTIWKPLKTGLVCDFISQEAAPYIALRADIDALPLHDLKTVPYRSRIDGVCHACGHDIHTAVMAGVAVFFRQSGIHLSHNLRFIFQPAEEPIPSGAPRMIEQDVLNGVQEIWAMHVDSTMALGTIGLTAGWVNAQSIKLRWEITGKGGHSARPHLANNPVEAGAKLVARTMHSVNHYRSKTNSNFAFTFTQFQSGSAYNVIPDSAVLYGTLRITDRESKIQLLQLLAETGQEIEAETGITIELTSREGAPPVINSNKIVDRFQRNLPDTYGIDFKVEENKRSMGGEDFSWYLEKTPGVLVKFGIALQENSPAVHTGWFDAPEEVIRLAVLFFLHQLLYFADSRELS